MRVLQVIDTLEVGGAERITVMLSNLLFRKNVFVSVMLLVKDGPLVKELHPNIEIIRLKREKRFDLSKMREFAQILKRFDLIHVHLKHNFRYTKIVARLSGLHHLKIIFHDHSHTVGYSKLSLKSIKDTFFKNVLKPAYYIGVSEHNCQWAIAYLKLKKENCYLLENVIEKKEVHTLRSEENGIIIVANITPIKNLEFALELVKKIDERVTIYGRIIENAYYEVLKKKIKELDIETKVNFITNCNEIQQELPKYKYGLHTSIKETGPLVLIEYLSQSLPFLSYSTGQVFNTIGTKLPQFFISDFDIEDWVLKLKEINSVPFEKLNFIYNDNFNTEIYISKCLKIYKDILNS